MKGTLVIVFAVLAFGYGTGDIDFAGMRSAEKAFNERQRQEVVGLMSPKTMFPDPQVRALAKAAGSGRVGRMDTLVERGIDVNSRGKKGAPPLFWALRKSNLEGFERLLELGATPMPDSLTVRSCIGRQA